MHKASLVLAYAALILVIWVVATAAIYTFGKSGCEDCWKNLESLANGEPTDLGMPSTRPAS